MRIFSQDFSEFESSLNQAVMSGDSSSQQSPGSVVNQAVMSGDNSSQQSPGSVPPLEELRCGTAASSSTTTELNASTAIVEDINRELLITFILRFRLLLAEQFDPEHRSLPCLFLARFIIAELHRLAAVAKAVSTPSSSSSYSILYVLYGLIALHLIEFPCFLFYICACNRVQWYNMIWYLIPS